MFIEENNRVRESGLMSKHFYYYPNIFTVLDRFVAESKPINLDSLTEEMGEQIGSQIALWYTPDNLGGQDIEYLSKHIKNLYIKRHISSLIKPSFIQENTPETILNDIESKIRLIREEEHLKSRDHKIAHEVREFLRTTSGNVATTDIHKELHLTTKQEKKTALMALLRLEQDGIIQKTGTRVGTYRIIEDKLEEIDVFGPEEKPLRVFWPLGIEGLYNLFPKTINIIAGESDSGKTAFLLSFMAKNMNAYPIHYYSSEMGPPEFKARLQKFDDIPFEEWKRIKLFDRSFKFADVIKPNVISIIDYLEINDEFWKVGGTIRELWEKLDKGVLLIAIQKKVGSEFARGGEFTMEKSRLYLSMSRDNILKIIKAKNWAQPNVKPAGKWKRYALVDGCKFYAKSNWKMEGDNDEN